MPVTVIPRGNESGSGADQKSGSGANRSEILEYHIMYTLLIWQ